MILLFQNPYRVWFFYLIMTKTEYENLLKRIQNNLGNTEKKSANRFELPVVDVMWEGQKTFLRNFSDFPKALRRDPDKVLQYLSKEFAVPAERLGDKAMFIGKRDPDDFNIDFTSAWAITGKVLEYNRKSTKKKPIVPMNIPISTKVGENIVQEEGR